MDCDHEHRRLKDELKNLLVVKFELDTPERETGAMRSEILEDREERDRLFDDPDIHDLLHAMLESSPRALKHVGSEEEEEAALRRTFDEVIDEMVQEAEGLGTPEE